MTNRPHGWRISPSFSCSSTFPITTTFVQTNCNFIQHEGIEITLSGAKILTRDSRFSFNFIQIHFTYLPISFSEQSLASAVWALLASSTTNEERARIGAMIESWQCQLESMPLAIATLTSCTDQNILFFALGAVQSLFDNYSETFSPEQVDGTWNLLVTRVNVQPEGLDEKCRNKALVCLSVISVHFPELIDRWSQINTRDTVPYFALLFEAQKNLMESHDPFSEKMVAIQNSQEALVTVLKANDISREWLVLANHLWQDDFQVLYQFAPKFGKVIEDPSLFAPFTDLFKGMVSGGVYTMDASDKAFLEQFMKIMLMFAEQALRSDDLETGVPAACLVFSEVFDFAPEFFVEPEREEFAAQVLKCFNASIRIIVNVPEELDALFDPMVVLFQHLWSYGSPTLRQFILEFVDVVIGLINENPALAETGVASVFLGASTPEHDPRVVPTVLVEYYKQRMAVPSHGLIFAISSSSEILKNVCAPGLCQVALTTMPPEVALYFIENCCHHCRDEIETMLQYLYSVMAKVWNRKVADALVSVTRYYGKLFLDNAKRLLEPLAGIMGTVDADGFVPMMKAITNILAHANSDEQRAELVEIINKNIARLVGNFIGKDDVNGLFEFLFAIVKSKRREFRDLYCALVDSICRMIQPLWTMKSEIVMDNLCAFVEMSCDKDLCIVNDIGNIVSWIANALTIAPVAAHFHLLRQLIMSENNASLIEATPQIFQFVLNVNKLGDSELAEEAVRLVGQLAQRSPEKLLTFIPPEFFISIITSDDPKITEEGLLLLSTLILTPPMQPFIEQAVKVIVQGMFTNFTENCIAAAIEFLLKLVERQVLTTEAVASLMLACVPQQGRESQQFTESLMAAADRGAITFHAKRMIQVARRATQSPKP